MGISLINCSVFFISPYQPDKSTLFCEKTVVYEVGFPYVSLLLVDSPTPQKN